MGGIGKKIRIKYVLTIALAIFGYYVGAAAASGQAQFQTYVVHGLVGPGLDALNYILSGCLYVFIAIDCKKRGIKSTQEGFEFYLGKYIGRITYYYSIIYIAGTILMCISGAGSTLLESWGIPYFVGILIMAAVIIISVIFDMNKILDLCSKLGYAIIAVLIIVTVASLANPVDGIAEGNRLALSADNVLRLSDNSVLSLFMGLCAAIPFALPFFISLAIGDSENTKKEIISYSVAGFGIICVLFSLLDLAQLANFSLVKDVAIPNLALMVQHAPILVPVYAIMVELAITTTIAPSTVMVIDSIVNKEKKPEIYKLTGVICAIVLSLVAYFASYGQIVNILFSIGGYVGIAMLIIMVIRRIVVAIKEHS